MDAQQWLHNGFHECTHAVQHFLIDPSQSIGFIHRDYYGWKVYQSWHIDSDDDRKILLTSLTSTIAGPAADILLTLSNYETRLEDHIKYLWHSHQFRESQIDIQNARSVCASLMPTDDEIDRILSSAAHAALETRKRFRDVNHIMQVGKALHNLDIGQTAVIDLSGRYVELL